MITYFKFLEAVADKMPEKLGDEDLDRVATFYAEGLDYTDAAKVIAKEKADKRFNDNMFKQIN